jgi:hypothetical protein
MSERAHHHTTGSYIIKADTIILNSTNYNNTLDFKNAKWIRLTPKKILISNNRSDNKKLWSILEKDKKYNYVPVSVSDLTIKIDSIKKYCLNWTKDSTNYESELKLIIREPETPKEPLVIIDGSPIKYEFMLNYYTLSDIQTLTYSTGDKLIDSGIHGGQAEYGVIILTTINKPKR